MSLKYGDLKGMILPNISIDEFEPKAGDDLSTIVVAFYLTDKAPADDLNTFIQRGAIDTIDVEVSPSTDENGNYLVFVEMGRNESFLNKFKALISDVTNLSGPQNWRVKTYFSNGREFDYKDPELVKYIIIDPDDYVPKDEFNAKELNESIYNFFRNSCISNLTISNNNVIITRNNKKIVAEVVDVGDYDTIFVRNFLTESAILYNNTSESSALTFILGNYNVLPIDKFYCLNYNDQVMLLRNVEISY